MHSYEMVDTYWCLLANYVVLISVILFHFMGIFSPKRNTCLKINGSQAFFVKFVTFFMHKQIYDSIFLWWVLFR